MLRQVSPAWRQGGVTLVEVLVAVLVLSIGLLGISRLHIAGLQFQHEAYLLSQATVLSQDMIDRMRANRQAALRGAYDAAEAGALLPLTCHPLNLHGPLAQQDIREWKLALFCNLPDGDGEIVRENDNHFRVIVTWRGRDDGAAEQVVTELRL